MSDIRIRCPKCEWEPDGRPYWVCDRCFTSWDTFKTAARCPGCGKVFKDTQCVSSSCFKFSPHLDWYEGLDNVVVKLKEEIEESWLLSK
jgi:predicted amidophosphoribosyltransferase